MSESSELSFGFQVFNVLNMLPSPVQPRIPLLSFLSLISVTRPVDVDLVDIPPALPPRRSKATSAISSSTNYKDLTSTHDNAHPNTPTASTLVSDIDVDSEILAGPSSNISTATTRRNSIDYRHHPQFQTRPSFFMDDTHLLEKRQRAKEKDARFPLDFGASAYDAVNQRWSSSGIKWRYARQGAHLTSIASQEMGDSCFERRSYVDGVAYFLRACPEDLTELETDILLRSAPWLAGSRGQRGMAIQRPTDRGRTFLHRAVQYVVGCLVVLAHILWYLIVVLCGIGARYERQYNISERIISNGHDLVSAVGRHSVTLGGRVNAMSDSKLCQTVTGICSWTMDSLTGGIQDGYGEGIMMVRRHTNRGQNDTDG